MDTNTTRTQASSDEYKTLRDETMKRVELRNQLWNFTLVTAGAALTFGTSANGTRIVFLMYPVIILFFAAAFSYNTLMLIEIGNYICNVCEKQLGFGWAGFLKDKYPEIEVLEHIPKYGLFVITEVLMLCFGVFGSQAETTTIDKAALGVGIFATLLTFWVIRIPETYRPKTVTNASAAN